MYHFVRNADLCHMTKQFPLFQLSLFGHEAGMGGKADVNKISLNQERAGDPLGGHAPPG